MAFAALRDRFSGVWSGSEETGTLRFLIVKPLRVLSFWSAVCLPFLYLPLLGRGLETDAQIGVFMSLVALNLVVLITGHTYRPR